MVGSAPSRSPEQHHRPPGGGAKAQETVQPGILQVLSRVVYPPIHGTHTSHLSEFRWYGRECWIELFTHPKLAQVAEAPLICATQFGFLRFRLIDLRKWLAARGLESSRLFVMRKI